MAEPSHEEHIAALYPQDDLRWRCQRVSRFSPCPSSLLIRSVAQFRTIPRGRSFIQVWKARVGPLRPPFRRMGLHGVSSHVWISASFIPVLLVVSITAPYPVSCNLISTVILPQGNPQNVQPRCCVFQHILMYPVSYTYTWPLTIVSPPLFFLFDSLYRTLAPRFLAVLCRILYITAQCHP
jgi:hypothetical protein